MNDQPATGNDRPTSSIVRAAILFEWGLGVVAVVAGYLLRLDPRPLDQIHWTLAAFGQGLAATLPMLALLWLMMHFPIGPIRGLNELMDRLIPSMFGGCTTLELFLISAMAGFGEELLFRGLIQQGLLQSTGSIWVALGLASLVFGLAHPITKTYFVLATLIGLYLGWLHLASDNLLVPIVAHGAYDFVALVYLLGRGSVLPSDSDA